MLNIAITGGRGRLAPMAARFFRDAGHSVRLFSRLEGSGLEPLESLSGPVAWQNIDAIVHCGWSSVPLTAEQFPENAARCDLPLLQRLVDSSHAAGENPHWIFLSTGAVYGNTGSEPVTEAAMSQPLGAYARGKAEAEKLLIGRVADAAILRISNLLGEQTDPARPQGILPRLIHAAKADQEMVLWGDGHATKDYLHCADFLRALESVLSSRLGGIWNVSREESVSLFELAAMVEELVGQRLRLRHEPHFDWDVSFSKISNRKLRERTAWRPRLSVREAVEECFVRFS